MELVDEVHSGGGDGGRFAAYLMMGSMWAAWIDNPRQRIDSVRRGAENTPRAGLLHLSVGLQEQRPLLRQRLFARAIGHWWPDAGWRRCRSRIVHAFAGARVITL